MYNEETPLKLQSRSNCLLLLRSIRVASYTQYGRSNDEHTY